MTDASDPDPFNPLRLIGMRTVGVVGLILLLELCLQQCSAYGKHVVRERTGDLSWRMLPDQDAWVDDLSARVHVNNRGYRDRDWDPPQADAQGRWMKDSRYYRVAVLGNSLSYGSMLGDDEVWPRKLEGFLREEFRRRGDERVPLVMNFAVEGYVHEQMCLVYDLDIRPYRPDLVILAFLPRDITPMKESRADSDYALRDWILRSAINDLLRRLKLENWVQPLPSAREEELEQLELVRSMSIRLDAFQGPFRPLWLEVGRRTRDMLRKIVADGGELLVLTLPLLPEVAHADRRAAQIWESWAARQDEVHSGGVHHLNLVEAFRAGMPNLAAALEQVGDLWDHQRIRSIDAGTPHAEESLFLWKDPGHFNAAGMELVAEEVFAFVRREVLPEDGAD